MLGWIFSIALLIVYVREPISAARPELIIAASLFALAGSIGYGLQQFHIKVKTKDEDEEKEE